MPRIARTFIKTGLICFLAALLIGVGREFESLNLPVLLPLFWHLLMVGWITQIIFGVSMWMFPGRTKEEGFTAQKWGWLTYIMLNTGLLLRIIAEPQLSYSSFGLWPNLVFLSAVLQFSAAITYAIEMWPRVMSKKKRRQRRKQQRSQKK